MSELKKYRVNLETTASMTIEVEAEDEDHAIDKAYDEIPGSVCARCSGWEQKWGLDLGEWELMKEETDGPYAVKAVEEITDGSRG